jgi:hypothetical protein
LRPQSEEQGGQRGDERVFEQAQADAVEQGEVSAAKAEKRLARMANRRSGAAA